MAVTSSNRANNRSQLQIITGTYFDGREMKECAADARNQEKLTELWQSSISLTGLQAHETVLPIGETR